MRAQPSRPPQTALGLLHIDSAISRRIRYSPGMDSSANSTFVHSHIQASRALGSMLGVAQLLGVQPKQVYFWIADVEQPSASQRRALQRTLQRYVAPA